MKSPKDSRRNIVFRENAHDDHIATTVIGDVYEFELNPPHGLEEIAFGAKCNLKM